MTKIQPRGSKRAIGERNSSDKEIAKVFSSLSSPRRLTIVRILAREGEKCACELAPILGLHISVVWRHLVILEEAGLLRSRKEGQRVLFRVADPRVLEILEMAERVAGGRR